MKVYLNVIESKIIGLSLDEVGFAIWAGELNEFMIGTTIKQYIGAHQVDYNGEITLHGSKIQYEGFYYGVKNFD